MRSKLRSISLNVLLTRDIFRPVSFLLYLENSFQQKHPHVIFEARTKANKGCANSGNLEWRISRRQKHISGLVDDIEFQHPNGAGRYKRDVREATKYIETAIVVDKAMFEKRNGSTRAEVVHDAIQVANIADLVSRERDKKENG